MLLSLHVKNFALIEEEEIVFGSGLNVLSGETGAGKSIILGALSLALGGKGSRDMMRDPEKDTIAEAVFSVGEAEKDAFRAMDIPVYDDEVILSRRLSGERSSAKINGETVPAARMREAGGVLLDIYGQHENQSLLNKKKHLELLDEYASDEVGETKKKLALAYAAYSEKKKEYDSADRDEASRLREMDFLVHEAQEITNAGLKTGEDELLEKQYKKLSHAQKISSALNEAYQATKGEDGAADRTGRALRELLAVSDLDDGMSDLIATLTDADNILNDFNRQLSDYLSDTEGSEEELYRVQQRLDEINRLKSKYGNSIDEILAAAREREEKIQKLKNYDEYLDRLNKELTAAGEETGTLCSQLTLLRQQASVNLCARVRDVLLDLNFLDVRFDMKFSPLPEFSANGADEAEFMISVNPGEPLRPLREIASGGELSRVMLALKTILAESDAIDTMIFDEIDAGISGRTAQAVSEKIYLVSRAHQVILITHLPQIAAMADHHFLISKDVVDGSTISGIQELFADQITAELARMVGGVTITDATMENARDMKSQADEKKKSYS